mmetsp:Transcript_20289/g.48317  ORF Transcript_20289/g.48317 Transcript_20289/m.48317 type:complete len:203 (+) Transcript_20289:87-695(+)
MSLLEPAFASLSDVKGPDGKIKTSKFLEGCSCVLPIVDKLGSGFSIVKSDINGNITRLSTFASKDPVKYEDYFQIVRDDTSGLQPGKYAGNTSVTKGMLWLKRALQFITGLIEKLLSDPSKTVSQAASETYKATLSKYHGMLTSGAFSVALKIVPSRESFLAKLQCENPEADLGKLVQLLSPILQEIDAFLIECGQDDPAKM